MAKTEEQELRRQVVQDNPVFWSRFPRHAFFAFLRFHLCKACRSAAVEFSPETARGSRHGKCREISGEILLCLFPQETKLDSAKQFLTTFTPFSPDALQLQMPNLMAFLTLQTFVFQSAVEQRGHEIKRTPEIIQKFSLRNWPISSADFPMTPMEGTEHRFFGPF